jgi:hypothetical protein
MLTNGGIMGNNEHPVTEHAGRFQIGSGPLNAA